MGNLFDWSKLTFLGILCDRGSRRIGDRRFLNDNSKTTSFNCQQMEKLFSNLVEYVVEVKKKVTINLIPEMTNGFCPNFDSRLLGQFYCYSKCFMVCLFYFHVKYLFVGEMFYNF